MQFYVQNPSFRAQRRITTRMETEIPRFTRNDKVYGFTLVELAIALMVIGLLVGGVLKGQELIENARLTRMIKDINDYDTAVMIFRSTYGGLPGDLTRPNRISNCSDALCNIAGNGDGGVQVVSPPEALPAWVQMGRAGLISGVNETTTDFRLASPVAPYGERHHIVLRLISTSHTQPSGLPPYDRLMDNHWVLYGPEFRDIRRLARMDNKMDDGKPFSGDMTLYVGEGNAICANTTTWEYASNQTMICSAKIFVETAN